MTCYTCGRSLNIRELIQKTGLEIARNPYTGREVVDIKDLELALKRESQGARSKFETVSLISTYKYSCLPEDEWRSVLNRHGVVVMIDPSTGQEVVDAEQFTMAYRRLHPSEKSQYKPPPPPPPEDWD